MKHLFILCVLVFSMACGASEVGEACEGVGEESGCVDGAICTNESGDTSFCRVLCDRDEDCTEEGHGCNGISGSNLKSCQP